MSRSGIPALAALVALAGCAVGPNYVPPDPGAPGRFERADATAAQAAGDLSRFWERFDDPLLTELVEAAVAGSPDLDAARARLRQARARRRIAGADFFPTVGYSAEISRTRSGSRFGGGGDVVDVDGGGGGEGDLAQSSSNVFSFYSAGFDASWELDFFGEKRRALEAARADVEASESDLAAVQVTLVAEVALSYVELRSFRARLAIARRNLATQAETLQIAEWREMAGLVTALDVAQARTSHEQTRASIPPLERGAAEAEHRLAILVGRAPGALRERLAAEAPIPAVPDRVLVGIPAEVLSRRPDVRAAERRIAAETARVGVAVAQQLPSLSLSGSIGIDALVGGVPGLASSLFAGIAGPLFQAGRLRNEVLLQRAVSEEALATYRDTVLTALEEVENALVAASTSRDRRDSLERAREAARNAASLARAQYEAGLVDFQAVLEAERTALSVEDALAATRAEAATAVVQLYKALGGGFSPDARGGR